MWVFPVLSALVSCVFPLAHSVTLTLSRETLRRKHHPLPDQWHHRLTAPSLGLQSKPLVLMITLPKPFHGGDEHPPADTKTNKWGPLLWSIITKVDCSTKCVPANCKHQLLHAWLFISFIHIIQELLHHKSFICINMSVNMNLNGLSEYFIINLIEFLKHRDRTVLGLEKLDEPIWRNKKTHWGETKPAVQET